MFLVLAVHASHQQFFATDLSLKASISHIPRSLLEAPMVEISKLGDSRGLLPLIGVGSVALWRPRKRWAFALPLVMLGAGILSEVAKWAVHRPRPNLSPFGFPSGHVLSLVVFFGLAIYLIWTSRARRRWRYTAAALGALPIALVAFSRLFLEAHWLSDVVGGLAVGLGYLLLVIVLVEWIARRRYFCAATV